MTKINDIRSLQSEINRLNEELSQRKNNMIEHVSLLKESMKPGNILASGIKNTISDIKGNPFQFAGKLAETGLLLLAAKWMLDPVKIMRSAFAVFRKQKTRKKEK